MTRGQTGMKQGASWYTAVRRGEVVRLRVDEMSAAELAKHWAPYVQVVEGDTAGGRAWTIRLADIRREGTLIDQPEAGETDYRVWIDGTNRTLSVEGKSRITQCRRLVRCLLRRTFMDQRYAFLHSAFVMHRSSGQGLALIGRKRSGKTSLMMAMLLSGKFDFLSNDDLTIDLGASEPVGLGWPRSVGIRRDTLRLFAARHPALRDMLAAGRHPAHRGTGNVLDRRAILYPTELVDVSGASLVSEAPISAIIAPRFSDEAKSPRLELVERADEAEALVRENLEDRASRQEPWLDPYFSRPSSEEIADQARALAGQVPVFRLAQSMDCLHQAAEALSLLAEAGL